MKCCLTFMAEVEAILNARPLTRLSLDPRDSEPLTPNHLLLMRSTSDIPPGVFVKEDLYGWRRWRQTQFLADQFWKRWRREYLPLLQVRQKWNQPQRNFEANPFNPIVPNWRKVAFQLDTMEYLCHTKVQVPLFPPVPNGTCPSW